jgi:glycylpeptide N-tetradecanoyltransferase
MLSFYTLPSSVIGNVQFPTLTAAFMYYTVATATPLEGLMTDALILARASGHHVFNALDLQHNGSFLRVRRRASVRL